MQRERSVAADGGAILENVRALAARFATERQARQLRRELDPADFDRLREAGFLLTGVPAELGGIWESETRSTRPVCEMLRTLAHGDSSVALVASMHPAVLFAAGWLPTVDAPEPFGERWQRQRREVFQTALDGSWWGTIASEAGSGGDIARTKAVARPMVGEDVYRLGGMKHFGSGSGVTSFMLTTAVPDGEEEPDWFFLDMRGVPWDGSAGVRLVAPWDGHGMAATQSHAMEFQDFPARRVAWPGMIKRMQAAGPSGFVPCVFSAVVVGVVETAIETARRQLAPKRDSLRAYERVEWSRVEVEGWLIQQAYEGMLRAVEEQRGREAPTGRTAIAGLAESALTRVCRVMGGGTFSRLSPFGHWFEDVRALGFLRPPWGLAYDMLFELAWAPPAQDGA